MGSDEFFVTSNLPDMKTAFVEAKEEALWENGHGGYTGTIAEKPGAVLLDSPRFTSIKEAMRWAEEYMETHNHNKWGEAWAVPLYGKEVGPPIVSASGVSVTSTRETIVGWLFFGTASS